MTIPTESLFAAAPPIAGAFKAAFFFRPVTRSAGGVAVLWRLAMSAFFRLVYDLVYEHPLQRTLNNTLDCVTGREEIEAVMADLRATEDKAEQAVKATEILDAFRAANPEAKQIRQAAVAWLRENRQMSHADIATLLNRKRGTAQAIAEGRSRSGKRQDLPDLDDDEA